MKNILACPICAKILTPVAAGFCCENQHNFDRARQGYINLLLAQHKSSAEPGDDKTMVKSRADFLRQGNYGPVAKAIWAALNENLPHSADINIVDSGCGVGYYLAAIKQHMPNPRLSFWGLDIAKEAIKTACTFDRSIHWCVASSKRMPFVAQSIDAIISVFAPIYFAEVARTLATNGIFLVVGPAEQHLIELRTIIFDEVHTISSDKFVDKIPPDFKLINTIPIQFSLNLLTAAEIKNLLLMTPFYWKSTREKQQLLLDMQTLRVSVDMRLWVLQKSH